MNDPEPLTEELLRAYVRGEMYLNLHTAANPAGEIRGQVIPGEAVVTAIEQISLEVPAQIAVRQNYPNPFNPETQIEFDLNRSVTARMIVVNSLGQTVAVLVDRHMTAGTYRVTFDGRGLPSGTYFARLSAGGRVETINMTIVK